MRGWERVGVRGAGEAVVVIVVEERKVEMWVWNVEGSRERVWQVHVHVEMRKVMMSLL